MEIKSVFSWYNLDTETTETLAEYITNHFDVIKTILGK